MNQSQPKLFSSGIESASLVASSGLLSRSWKVISDINSNENLFYKVHRESELTIIAFVTSRNDVQDDLVSTSNLMDNPFEFLCTKDISTFSVNCSAISLFNEHRPMLDQLKSQIDVSKPLIVTGHALGGSIASLFTLWLLESIVPDKKPPLYPLCITFGSPLIGDENLQKAISRSSTWNSCFLHVASHQDPLPSSFISTKSYPFGIFLLCSDYGSACFEYPETILMLLKAMRPINQRLQSVGYGEIVEDLSNRVIFKDVNPTVTHSDALKASLTLQLRALGFANTQNIDINAVVKDMEQREIKFILKKKKRFDPSKKLNEVKMNMAQLEWYKKVSKNQGRGYYDNYKDSRSARDQDVEMFIKVLNSYWKDMVVEAEMKPMTEGAAFRTRWLFAGTNYRRMVEPLDIARYYKGGKRDYVNNGRSEHYKRLEKWLEEDEKRKREKNQYSKSKQNVESILTTDSCFWAHVEEALISCQELKDGGSSEAKRKLVEFEEYVYGQLKEYAVSPEIFLQESSYMSWWKGYERVVSYNSRLGNFMRNRGNLEQYEKGVYDFP